MKVDELHQASLPVAYVRLTLEQAEARGVPREDLLKDLGLGPDRLRQPDARVPFIQYGRIVARALRRTGDAGLGYDFGLRAGLTTHALVGFGVMSQPTLREALSFIDKYLGPLRSPGFSTRFFLDGVQAGVEVNATVQFGPLRQYAFDIALVGLVQLVQPFLPRSEIELRFDCEEPPHFAPYRERLPRVRFGAGVNQIRFPKAYLDRPIDTGNSITAQLVARECDREMAVLGHTEDIVSRVRAMLVRSSDVPLDLEGVARRLSMSSRTLKRHLSSHGFTFRDLVEELRREVSLRLLDETTLSVEQVARRVGYTAHGNFIRAFRKWTGTTPSGYREQAGRRPGQPSAGPK